jgi:hypothetical protein
MLAEVVENKIQRDPGFLRLLAETIMRVVYPKRAVNESRGVGDISEGLFGEK